MARIRTVLVLLFAAAAAGAADAPKSVIVRVPVVGSVWGIGNVRWKTEVDLYNDTSSDLNVRVSLPAAEPSTYRLRSEAHPFGLATVEAIARALRILEGDRGGAIELALLHVFHAMVERTLWSRGDLDTEDVTGGVPGGALRHDPRSGEGRAGPSRS